MKNKVITFLALVIFFMPFGSYSNVQAYTNIDIVFRNQVADAIFCFSRDYYSDVTQDWQRETLQCNSTKNLYGFMQMPSLTSRKYRILQWTNLNMKPVITCQSNNPNRVFNYERYGVVFGSTLTDENILCDFSNNNKPANPILIVPGLMGTEMKKGEELLWADIPRMVNPFNSDSFMDPLEFNSNLMPTDDGVYNNDVIRKEPLFDYTEGLINEFEGQGYVEGQDLFTFPYDWRYGVSGKYSDGKTNSDLLAEKIQSILQQTGASKVDVVAHSLGGLITKQYAVNHQTDNSIGKAVFVGVPNTGAPKAVKGLLQGDNFGVLGLSDKEMKKIAENMPSIYDLLPDQQYYDVKGSYIKIIDQTKCFDDSSIPCDVKDLNYQESNDFLNNQGFNSLAINQSQNLHTQSFDNFDLRTAGIDLYAIDGCKKATIGKIVGRKYNDIFGRPQLDFYMPSYVLGDDTVPLESATNLPINENNKYYALVSDHGKMPSQNGIRQEIVNLISGSNLSVSNNLITQNIDWCQLNGKAISVFSPVDILVTDQNGNKLGLADDGSVMNEIPNADFEIWGDHKFLYLPQDSGQVYSIGLQGTDTGTYTIKSENIINNKITSAEIFSDLPVTPNLTGQINIDSSNNSTRLFIKENGVDEEIILPSKVLDFSTDIISPEVMIYFNSGLKDLSFLGSDNLSDSFSISVNDNNNVVILTDQAGNTTELDFKERNRRSAKSAEISSIKYNGTPVNIGSNSFSYSWAFDNLGKLTKLTQKVKSRNNYSITAVYDGVNTKLTGTTSAGRISQTFIGLKILKVTTNKGDLGWSY